MPIQFSVGNETVSGSRPFCDSLQYEDPIANQVLWSPLPIRGAANCCTHRAVISPDGDRLEFRRTLQSNLHIAVMLAVGCVLLATGFTIGIRSGGLNDTLGFIATGVVLGAVGGYFWYDSRQPRFFDRSLGHFQLVRPNPASTERRLTQIHALQIVSRYVNMVDSPDFYCHQSNLVLKNAARLNVVAHGSYAELREDAAVLSRFLDVPVWDQAVQG